MNIPRMGRRASLTAILILFALAPSALHAQDRPAAAVDPYRLEAGDLIEIRVYGESDLTARMRVPRQGTVSFPLIGNVSLLGRAPGEVETEVARRLEESGILRSPNVSLFVQEFAPRSVFVLGSVQHPGSFEMPVGRPLLLPHAISMAGGFMEKAHTSRVEVYRNSAGRPLTFKIAFPADGSSSEEMYMALEPGDQINVPSLGYVYVVGEVSRAGQVLLKAGEDLTLSQVMALVGSFQERISDLDDIQILRKTGGQVRAFSVNLREYLEGKAGAPDPAVMANDVIYVKRR